MRLTNLVLKRIRTGFYRSYKLYKSRQAFLSASFFSPHPSLFSFKIDPSGLFEKAILHVRMNLHPSGRQLLIIHRAKAFGPATEFFQQFPQGESITSKGERKGGKLRNTDEIQENHILQFQG
jgi:hypothetical protein